MAKLKNRYIATRVEAKQCRFPVPGKINLENVTCDLANIAKMTVSSSLADYFEKEFSSMKSELSQVQAEVMDKFSEQK
jgi:hypothetical protein